MNQIRILFSYILFVCYAVSLFSQDVVPETLKPQSPLTFNSELPWMFQYSKPLDIEDFIPQKFAGFQTNLIVDPTCSLEPFFRKLDSLIVTGKSVLRIVHIGDSHVRGHFFPGKVKSGLEQLAGSAFTLSPDGIFDYNSPGISIETGVAGVAYQIFGINGATAQKFCNPEYISRISSLKPDLIIISFGTNEGYTRRYNSVQHTNQLDMLVKMLRESCSSSTYLLTTPPGAYMKYRGRYSVNQNTGKVSEVITSYAAEHGIAYWDLFNIVGGSKDACRNWYDNKLMQRDRIHFTKSGYDLMGVLLFQALIKSYNTYVEH